MKQRAPFLCDVCGQDVGRGRPFFEVHIAEFGLSDINGNFCSLDHAREWVAGKPPLKPLKKPFLPGTPGVAAFGVWVLFLALSVLALLVIGVLEVFRAVLSWL